MSQSSEDTSMVNLRDDIKCLLTDDGKNLASLRCQRCPSLILKKKEAKFVKKQV